MRDILDTQRWFCSFIESYIKGRGIVTDVVRLKFPMRHTFKFHKKEIAYIDVELYRNQKQKEKQRENAEYGRK